MQPHREGDPVTLSVLSALGLILFQQRDLLRAVWSRAALSCPTLAKTQNVWQSGGLAMVTAGCEGTSCGQLLLVLFVPSALLQDGD